MFNLPGIYDYECNQGNHNLTQFGTVTVSAPLNLTYYNTRPFYFENFILYFNYHLLPVSFKIYGVSGQMMYDVDNYSNRKFNLNNIENSGLYILSLFNQKQKLISNSIFIK